MKQLHWSGTEKILSEIQIYQMENLIIKSRCLHFLLEVCMFYPSTSYYKCKVIADFLVWSMCRVGVHFCSA